MVNREDWWIMKVMMIIVMMSAAHHTSADLSTLLQLTATSVIERPERAALEPPTVTSLKPPDRNKSNRGAGGITVQSEQSGSHIPPVVASRSPSSSSFSRNYNSRYLHMNPRSNQPAAPVATASSGSRSGDPRKIDGRRDPPDGHQVVPIPTPHLVNGTSVSIPQESSWVPPVSFAPLPRPPPRNTYVSSGYAPVASSFPRHARIPVESETFEPTHQGGTEKETNLPSGGRGGGVWGETDGSSAGGMWKETRRRPVYPQDHLRPYEHSFTEDTVRTDTFGHRISEDLSHLSSEYSPRRVGSSTGHAQPPGQSPDTFHPLRNNYPPGQNIHRMDNNNHRRLSEDAALDFRTEDISDQKAPTDDNGSAPTSYESSSHTEKTQKSPVHPRLYASDVDHGDTRRPLTLYEIWHMVNMSNWEEFVEFLKRKGLNMSQVLTYMNEGATKQDFLKLFAKPDLVPKYESSSSSSSPPSNIPNVTTKDSDTLHGESFIHEITNHNPFLSTTSSRKIQEESDDNGDDDEDDGEDDVESKSTAHKGKRKNRRKGKNKKKNKRKRGRNHDRPVVPDFTYTTVIFPIDNNQHNDAQLSKAETSATVLPTAPLLQGQIAHETSSTSAPTHQSTSLALPEYSPELDMSSETSAKDSTVPGVSLWPKSSLVSSTTPMKSVLPPVTTTPVTSALEEAISPAHKPSELEKGTRTTPLPRSKEPKTASLTLPPASKPSEVSIISFTVMEVPLQAAPEETVLEDSTPQRREKSHRNSPKTTAETHPKRIYSSTKLLPSMTPKKMNDEPVIITPYMREESKDKYTFPVKGFMIITGIMGALAVFTLVVLISYAIIKCSKQPVVNNYQVSEQKTTSTQQS